MSGWSRADGRVPAPLALLALAAVALGTACSPAPGDALLVSAAASLAPAVREIAAAYEADHPGAQIRINAAASGVLMQQIRQGAPVDVFLSASSDEMQRLADEGRLDPAQAVSVAGNRLVLVTRPGTAAPADDQIRPERYASIALANPRTAPLGRYTRQALTALGVWDAASDRAVLGQDARQVGEYVARGDVEAGIVYVSDALLLARRVNRGPLLGEDTHEPIIYMAVALDDAGNPRLAADFLAFLRSPAATAILRRHGFTEAAG